MHRACKNAVNEHAYVILQLCQTSSQTAPHHTLSNSVSRLIYSVSHFEHV